MTEQQELKWSPQQEEALTAVKAWLDGRDRGLDPRQCFYLAGYAGSGKTTLAREFAAEAELLAEFVAFTGKAALVLQQKGCPTARTIHNLIYIPVEKSKVKLFDLEEELGTLAEGDPRRTVLESEIQMEKDRLKSPSFALREESDITEFDLIICDEVSMVDEQMGSDLTSYGVPILVLGDPAQLPPVKASQGFFTKHEPDFMLTEVHRQAADSPVLKLATQVRNKQRLHRGEYGESKVVGKGALNIDEAMNHDQIICGKNATRHAINKQVRKTLGREGDLPVEGDRLICLRNDSSTGMMNGSFWVVLEDPTLEPDGDTLRMQVDDADRPGHPRIVMAHRHHFERRELPWFKAREALEFDYGYAVTCHKAQGSQWGSVLVYDESYCFRQDRHKWLYTAITRASQFVTIVQA